MQGTLPGWETDEFLQRAVLKAGGRPPLNRCGRNGLQGITRRAEHRPSAHQRVGFLLNRLYIPCFRPWELIRTARNV